VEFGNIFHGKLGPNHHHHPALMSVKKSSRAGSSNFPTDAANFQPNSVRQPQISDAGDLGCSKFRFFSPKLSEDGGFWS